MRLFRLIIILEKISRVHRTSVACVYFHILCVLTRLQFFSFLPFFSFAPFQPFIPENRISFRLIPKQRALPSAKNHASSRKSRRLRKHTADGTDVAANQRTQRTNGNKPVITGRGESRLPARFVFPAFVLACTVSPPFPLLPPRPPPHSNVKLSGLIFRLCRAPRWPP